MTIMEQVRRIEADIRALPAEYRALVTKAHAWEMAHVALAMSGAGLAGYALHMILRWPF